MPARSKRAEAMKAERQEDMREKLRNAGLIEQAIESIEKMEKIQAEMRDSTRDEDGEEVASNINDCLGKIKAVEITNNQRLKLINKILPDLKHTEVDGNLGLKVLEINRTGMHDESDDEDLDE